MADPSVSELLLQQLSELRAEARADSQEFRGNLSAIGASLAAVQTRAEAAALQIAEMRAENRSEMQLAMARIERIEALANAAKGHGERIPHIEERISAISAVGDRRHQEMDLRVRALEGDSRETGVFRRGAETMLGIFVRWVLPLVGAAVVGWAASGVKIPG